jgi:hypothetical protein
MGGLRDLGSSLDGHRAISEVWSTVVEKFSIDTGEGANVVDQKEERDIGVEWWCCNQLLDLITCINL